MSSRGGCSRLVLEPTRTASRVDGRWCRCEPVSEIAIRHWQRYGRSRLYLTGADGLVLGWHDVAANETHYAAGADVRVVDREVAAWRAVNAGASRPNQPESESPIRSRAAAIPKPAPAAAPPEPPTADADLMLNRAGSAPRKEAIARRKAAPIRTFVARAFGVHTEERAWRIGADGEEYVAIELERLVARDPRWQVLHSIPVSATGADIDHLVVGPAGAYTINTKHHPGARIWVYHDAVRVNGTRVPYVRNARYEAARATRALSAACGKVVPVAGLVVPVGARAVEVKAQPKDVTVVPRRQIANWLDSQPAALNEAGIAFIVAAARRHSTWTRQYAK